MANPTDELPEDSANTSQQSQPTDQKDELITMPMSDDDILQQMAGIFLLWWNWAYFEISISQPHFDPIEPPLMIQPEAHPSGHEPEFVYPICDHGYKLSTSKATEMYTAGMSMCKLFYTIEKMIFILIERLKEGGIDATTEVQVTFDGHLLAQRKAFESIINLSHNVVVTNFDPGTWGEKYLEIVKRLADKGYGYPPEAPRDVYKLVKIQSLHAKNK